MNKNLLILTLSQIFNGRNRLINNNEIQTKGNIARKNCKTLMYYILLGIAIGLIFYLTDKYIF